MKLFNYLDRYITDDMFSVVVMENGINVINYVEVLDFSSKEIAVKYDNGMMIIKGDGLVVSKMLDDELLIKGKIKNISYSGG